ncbi:hypothetical protein PsorP6_014809 [Peronosclerospora sorghi]|uniref:Uncharacterized protein n=1 Tax=Peronosclerospora sorghi TaxID=230839 RepID=A0ACC0VSR4_9STRA|nr:hypothetical protein PsorP6_014809 [Peronosclerospora sorghi]
MVYSHSESARQSAASFKTGLKRLTGSRSRHNSWDRTTNDMSYVDSEAELDHPLHHARVRLADTQLLHLAREATERVDFPRLRTLNTSLLSWKWKTVANDFTAFSHGDGNESMQEVMATGEMKASLNELAHLLSTTTDADHDRLMRSMHKDYIHGAVVHVADLSPESISSAPIKSDMETKLTVKTSAFERSRMFKNHEQWCYLEYYEKRNDADAFTVTMTSIPPKELAVGKMKADRVDELPHVTAAYMIEKNPLSHSVRVVFYARIALDGDETEPGVCCSPNDESTNPLFCFKKHQKRLMRLATGASHLPDVIRRRRFGTQPLANCSAFEVKNTRCTCCAKSLRYLTRKKRCHVCGYFICHQCWSIQPIETFDGRISSVRACTRCVEFVNNGDYSRVDQDTRGKIEVVPDSPNLPSTEVAGKALTNFLHDALQTSSGDKCKSVISVIRHLLNQEKEKDDVRSESSDRSSVRLTDEEVKKYAEALDNDMHIELVPPEQCILANSKGRNYPLNMAPDPKTLSKPPMPKDEQARISAIEKGGFAKITDTDELDLLCELVAREMKCSTGLVTLISENEQHVLASNKLPFRHLHMPRNESVCQHTIMNDAPLLVPNLDSDIRFQNLPILDAQDLRYYFGFPLKDANNQVVGAVCCLDDTSHRVSASQYSAMKKLADTASKIVQIKGKQAQKLDSKGTAATA